MTTTLEPAFLQAAMVMQDFRPAPMLGAKASLLTLALTRDTFTAAQIPEEITGGSAHLAGAATGALIAEGLLMVVGRVKSPKPNAKGRKVDVLAVVPHKRGAVKAWLTANHFPLPYEAPKETNQMELAV